MKQCQTIVVAAGLDKRDATTLRHVAGFARAAETKHVYVVHIAPSFDLLEETARERPELVIPIDEEIEQRLKTLLEAQPGLFPPDTLVQGIARQGPLVPELIRLAVQKTADLLCLGRWPPDDQDLLSDAALKVVRKAPCSVLVIPAGVEPRFGRILVPIDFSDHSREALEVACAVGRSTPDAAVTVQHVYTVPLGWHKSGHSYEEFAAIMKRHAELRWNDLLSAVDSRGVPVRVRFDLSDKVPRTILAAADEMDANLIVMGSHGRTRPAAALLGHVADTVCSRTARPVLCVKKKGEVVNFLHALLQFFEFEGR